MDEERAIQKHIRTIKALHPHMSAQLSVRLFSFISMIIAMAIVIGYSIHDHGKFHGAVYTAVSSSSL
jgi:hypothetical protein